VEPNGGKSWLAKKIEQNGSILVENTFTLVAFSAISPFYFESVFGYIIKIYETKRLFFLDMIKTVMNRKPRTFILFMAFLFTFTCAYSLFDAIREADFLSGKKYEATDVEDLYAEKQSSPSAALVSPALFSPLLDIIFGFLSSSSTPNILFTPTFPVLRC
jgi:hypothetical protein